MKQFNNGNPVISAALDNYDLNNDMAELVEALQVCAIHICYQCIDIYYIKQQYTYRTICMDTYKNTYI